MITEARYEELVKEAEKLEGEALVLRDAADKAEMIAGKVAASSERASANLALFRARNAWLGVSQHAADMARMYAARAAQASAHIITCSGGC